jgi:DNA-binding Lrp family transcriptional regulator
MDEADMALLRAAQEGLKLTERPYQALGESLGISEDEVIERLKALIERGAVRRFAATIGHLALGIVANAMIAWKVEPEDLERVGWLMASFEDVTHCYERAARPEWPYNLYTMVHSRSREECLRTAEELSRASGVKEYRILFSEREYKKTSARI